MSLPLTGAGKNLGAIRRRSRWGGVVCRCSADVVPELAVQVGGAHVRQQLRASCRQRICCFLHIRQVTS
jgi:hypothetical protein